MPNAPAIEAPAEYEAEAFLRSMGSGRNRAVLLSARPSVGPAVECVVKVPGLMENPKIHPLPCLLEWLGAVLGPPLGVAVPRPLLIRISTEFADSVRDAGVAAGLKKSVGAVFGSEFVHGASMVSSTHLDGSLREQAATVLAFDVFIHNLDRRAENPNAFQTRDSLLAFDHAEAFSFIWPVIGAPPAATDPLRVVVDRHPVVGLLRKKAVSTVPFREALAALSDAVMQEIATATPVEWCGGPASGKLEVILQTLKLRRDAVASWLPQVEKWIQPQQ